MAGKPVKSLSRRDFFRRSLHDVAARVRRAVRRRHDRVPVAQPQGRVRVAGRGRQHRRHQGRDQRHRRARLQRHGPVLRGAVQRLARAATSTTRPRASSAEGIMALYQRCVHLGCRVPFCLTSKWFECPCHGSKYNGAGRVPAGAGSHAAWTGSHLGHATATWSSTRPRRILGPPRGVDTIDQPPQGPFCVAPG